MTDKPELASAIFARKVRKLRRQACLSQAELGRRVGLGQARTATIEATGSVTINQAQTFARVLGVPVEMLLYEQPPDGAALLAAQIEPFLHALALIQLDIRQLEERLAAIPSASQPAAGPGAG